MIQINNKANCCGCSACEQVCPKHCISFKIDSEGFAYPAVDMDACINCGLCERVCPVLNQGAKSTPQKTLAAINNDQTIRRNSSSGGVFTALAEKIICAGGHVYGARFNKELGVEHSCTNQLERLENFRGSKYLQSTMNDTFKNVRSDLKSGIKVLFSGTPCQVAGLKNFLQKDYENLITVDIICHGVPSPKVWRKYLDTYSGIDIESASFRDKDAGWHRFGMRLSGTFHNDASYWHRSGIFSDDHYMQVFLSNLSLRPSCYYCPSKGGKSHSDITLGDFWGIEHIDSDVDDDKGTSLVLINTPKGEKLFSGLNIEFKEEPYEEAVKYNPCIEVCVAEPEIRAKFFRVFTRSGFNAAYKATMIPPISRRIINKLMRIFGNILGKKGKRIVYLLRKK